jgi:hypothetical protein
MLIPSSLLSFLNTACLARKLQIPILIVCGRVVQYCVSTVDVYNIQIALHLKISWDVWVLSVLLNKMTRTGHESIYSSLIHLQWDIYILGKHLSPQDQFENNLIFVSWLSF